MDHQFNSVESELLRRQIQNGCISDDAEEENFDESSKSKKNNFIAVNSSLEQRLALAAVAAVNQNHQQTGGCGININNNSFVRNRFLSHLCNPSSIIIEDNNKLVSSTSSKSSTLSYGCFAGEDGERDEHPLVSYQQQYQQKKQDSVNIINLRLLQMVDTAATMKNELNQTEMEAKANTFFDNVVRNPFASNDSRLDRTNLKSTCRDEKRRATHNEVERRRRDKINNWILKLAKIVPHCSDDNSKYGQSKGGILAKAYDYIQELQELSSQSVINSTSTINEKILRQNQVLVAELDEIKQKNNKLLVEVRRLQELLSKYQNLNSD